MRQLVRHAVTTWMLWRAHRRIRRAIPELVALDARQADVRSQHRSGAKAVASERKKLVTERLRDELGLAR